MLLYGQPVASHIVSQENLNMLCQITCNSVQSEEHPVEEKCKIKKSRQRRQPSRFLNKKNLSTKRGESIIHHLLNQKMEVVAVTVHPQ